MESKDTKYPPVTAPSFNLWDEPWIDVLFCNGDNGTLSLTEIFQRANEIKDVCGELPIQDISILRLMLCIFHASTDNTLDDWIEWYETRTLPLEDITQYRDSHHDEFYLFHPTHPFMQVADLTFADEGKSTLSTKGLVYDYPTDGRIMRLRDEQSVATLSCAEAARLLITAQNYDVCGVHTPMKGDIAKSGKAYPTMSSLAHNTVIVLEGDTLLETLLYNAVPNEAVGYDLRKSVEPDEDLPSWDASCRSNDVVGPCSAMSRQSRRIRLVPNSLSPDGNDDLLVIGAMIGVGNEVSWADLFYYEDMSIFNFTTPSKTDAGFFKPRYFSKQPYKEMCSRIIGAKATYHGDATEASRPAKDDRPQDKLANNMLFAQMLLDDDIMEDRTRMLSFRSVTVHYGTMESVITQIDDDRTRVSPYSLAGENKNEICMSILQAINNIEGIEKEYRIFLKNSQKITCPSTTREGRPDDLDQMKFALEQAFLSWTEEDLLSPVRNRIWKQKVTSVARDVAQDYIRKNANVKDFIGYVTNDGKQNSVCVEEAKLYNRIDKLFPKEG